MEDYRFEQFKERLNRRKSYVRGQIAALAGLEICLRNMSFEEFRKEVTDSLRNMDFDCSDFFIGLQDAYCEVEAALESMAEEDK